MYRFTVDGPFRDLIGNPRGFWVLSCASGSASLKPGMSPRNAVERAS